VSSINFYRGRYGVSSCGRQDRIEFRPTYTPRDVCERLIGSGGRCLCLLHAAKRRGTVFEDTRGISNIQESDEHTTGRPSGRSPQETSPKNLPRFSALRRLVLLRLPPGSSFVRPRSRSPRFLFLSLSRRTYSLHLGRCTRGVAARLCGVPLGMILRLRGGRKKRCVTK